MALRYGKCGIRINAVGPAFINTWLTQKLEPEVQREIVGLHGLVDCRGWVGRPGGAKTYAIARNVEAGIGVVESRQRGCRH